MDKPVESVPLLNNFVNGDDTYRNSRFKLIPYISKVGLCLVIDPILLVSYPSSALILFFVCLGILDSKAECWEDSMPGGSSTRNKLFSWEELHRGNKNFGWHVNYWCALFFFI